MKIEKWKFHAPHVKINEERNQFNRYAVSNIFSFIISTIPKSLRDIRHQLKILIQEKPKHRNDKTP